MTTEAGQQPVLDWHELPDPENREGEPFEENCAACPALVGYSLAGDADEITVWHAYAVDRSTATPRLLCEDCAGEIEP